MCVFVYDGNTWDFQFYFIFPDLLHCIDGLKSMFSMFQTGTLLSLPYSSQREALSVFSDTPFSCSFFFLPVLRYLLW